MFLGPTSVMHPECCTICPCAGNSLAMMIRLAISLKEKSVPIAVWLATGAKENRGDL